MRIIFVFTKPRLLDNFIDLLAQLRCFFIQSFSSELYNLQAVHFRADAKPKPVDLNNKAEREGIFPRENFSDIFL
jgi:hypothetical protein